MIRAIARRLLRRLFRGGALARILLVVVLGLVLVAAAVGLFQSRQPGLSSLALPLRSRAPESTESYLKGTQNYNAEQVIGSLSDEALAGGRSRGVIQEQQQRLDAARDRGVKMEQYDYVGGKSLPDGTSLQFYVVTMRGLGGRSEPEYVSYIFTLDRSGKITRIQ